MHYSISGRIRPEKRIRSEVAIEGNGITITVKPVRFEGINEPNVTAEFANPDYCVETAEEILREIIDSLLLVLSMEYNQPCTFEVATKSVARQCEEQEITLSSGQATRTVIGRFSADAHIVEGIEDESWLAALRCRGAVRNSPAIQYVLGLYRKALEDRENDAFHLYRAIEAVKKDLGGEDAMKQALGISSNYHRVLKQSLNVHRHARLPGEEDPLPLGRKECLNRSKQIIRKYVAYCQHLATTSA